MINTSCLLVYNMFDVKHLKFLNRGVLYHVCLSFLDLEKNTSFRVVGKNVDHPLVQIDCAKIGSNRKKVLESTKKYQNTRTSTKTCGIGTYKILSNF